MSIYCNPRIFHNLILNHVFPGTIANSVNFQIDLLEGLHRWNQDRGAAALSSGSSALRSYSDDLLHCVNKNYQKLLAPTFCPHSRYTSKCCTFTNFYILFSVKPTWTGHQDQ